MPIASSHRLRVALWIALAVLILPATLSMLDLVRGDDRALLRLAALAIVAITLIVALRRQWAFEVRVREREELYELARRATQARDDVLGIVSHDLRNPIAAISMCARTLADHPPENPAEQRELLSTVLESTEWMNRLIQDLLDAANIERGRLSLDMGPRDAVDIVRRAQHMFQVEAAQSEIALNIELPDDLPPIGADDARLVQVLGNLIRNAIKFTPSGGSITTAAARAPGGVTFSVTDTGRGIPAEHLARIFDRYWQSSKGARARGSGLGLSIARGIVEAHGGTISVRSEPGRGTTVEFTIPEYTDAASLQPLRPASEARA